MPGQSKGRSSGALPAERSAAVATAPGTAPADLVSLAAITEQLRRIADAGQSHEAAAGLHAARAALMDIARLNGLATDGPVGGARSLEELLAAIPDDDIDPDAGAAGQTDPAKA